MRKHGAKIELWDNIKGLFGRRPATAPARQDNSPKKVEAKKQQKA
jgi:YidC/Oxa1 family membrane protein insertase